MIVKITYSAELEEVPSEVSKIILSVKKEAEELFHSLATSSKELVLEKDLNASLNKLNTSLKILEKLEAKLKDSQAILTGYKNIIDNPPDKKETDNKKQTKENK